MQTAEIDMLHEPIMSCAPNTAFSDAPGVRKHRVPLEMTEDKFMTSPGQTLRKDLLHVLA